MEGLTWIVSNILLASLLAAAALIVQRRLHEPAVAHFLWVLVLVKLVTPPLIEVPLWEFRKSPCELGTCSCGPHSYANADSLWPTALIGVWLTGGLVGAWCAGRRWVEFRRLLSDVTPAPIELQTMASRAANDLNLRYAPDFLVTTARIPPFVAAGWPTTKLVAPAALFVKLTREQRTALLLHELTHLKRGDHLIRILETIVGTVFWWLPGLGWVCRQIRACEEACCDAAVVSRRPKARRDYARLLLDVVDFAAPLQARTITAMNAAGVLEQRLRTILAQSSPLQTTQRWMAYALATLALAATPLALRCDWNHVFRPNATEPTQAPAAVPWAADRCETPVVKVGCCPS